MRQQLNFAPRAARWTEREVWSRPKFGDMIAAVSDKSFRASPQSTGEKLLAVYLGGRAPRCNTELHDVVFVVAESVEAAYEKLLDKWFGDPMRAHIDSWMQLRSVDGYRISLHSKPSGSKKKLFFINLGAYTPGQFTELHANTFVVAESEAEVKKRAKGELLRGAQSVHTDDLYDIDDCLEIGEVDGRHIHLEPTSEAGSLDPQNGYHIFPPKVLKAYAARKNKQTVAQAG